MPPSPFHYGDLVHVDVLSLANLALANTDMWQVQ